MRDPSALPDQSVYRRGTVAAIVGLVIQLALTIAIGLLGLWTRSPAIEAATWHFLAGLPIWVVLALVYSQFAAERREALASERLASQDAASSVLFGDLSDELQRSRQRLANLVSYGLPGVSFVVAAYLIAVGGGLFWRLSSLAASDDPAALTISPKVNVVTLMFMSGAIAFVAFIAARWISGYTRVREWQLLRGGASYLMSCFVLGGLIFVGAVVASLLADTSLFNILATAVPVVMMFVGGEILLTGLLAAYRPKRPGEMPRPAFDSRLLGLLTAPESLGQVVGELINYQFGVEVSRSWLYKLLGQALTPLTLLGGAVLLGMSTLTIVGPDEQGLVTRFGTIRGAALPPGIHLKLPWPIETAVSYPVGKVLQITVSSDPAGRAATEEAILWTNTDDNASQIGMEYYPTALDPRSADDDSGGRGGMGLVNADVVVQYRVRDLIEFLSGSLAAKDAITAIAQQETTRYFACEDIDELLTRGRTEGGAILRKQIQNRIDSLGLGLDVVGVSITTLKPPAGGVSRAFHQQIGAQQQRETLIQEGRRDAVVALTKVAGSVDRSTKINDAIISLDHIRSQAEGTAPAEHRLQIAEQELEIEKLLEDARGEAAQIIHAARGYRWTKAVGERSAQERFAGELLAYQKAPNYYQMRRFLDVLAEGLSNRRKFVLAGEQNELPTLQMDFNDPASAIDTLLGE